MQQKPFIKYKLAGKYRYINLANIVSAEFEEPNEEGIAGIEILNTNGHTTSLLGEVALLAKQCLDEMAISNEKPKGGEWKTTPLRR